MNKNTSGFTLVEIVVSMAVASLVLTALSTVLVSGRRTSHYYALTARAAETGDAIARQVRTKLQYAGALVIDDKVEAGLEEYGSIGFSSDGDFLMDGKPLYRDPELYYGCRLTLPAGDSPLIYLEVYLTDRSGKLLYRSRETIKLLNMELDGEPVNCRIPDIDGTMDSSDQTVLFFYLGKDRR